MKAAARLWLKAASPSFGTDLLRSARRRLLAHACHDVGLCGRWLAVASAAALILVSVTGHSGTPLPRWHRAWPRPF